MHCDPHVNGEPWPYAPRVILKSLIQRAADAGFEPWVGAEVEYFLLHRNADGSLPLADTADTAAQPCYDARGVTRMYDHLTAISAAMNRLGWSNYANDHEDGNGQFEQNFEFADALTTADRVVTLRYLLSVIAAERGMVATFMPKPFADKTGSGLHLHLSLTSGGTPVFPADDDERGLGLSDTAYAFVGGILEHACALQAVVAPTVNSYKRTGATPPRPARPGRRRLPTYGGNDRTHYIRVPDAAPRRAARRRRLGQPVPGHRGGAGRGHRRHQAQRRPGARRRRATAGRPAADPVARGRRVRGRPGDHRRPRRCGRGRRGLLRERQARRVLRLPRRGQPMGDRHTT